LSEHQRGRSALTSAASAALRRASSASPPGPDDDPPSVRGGPPTFGLAVVGTEAVGAVGRGAAESRRRPGWEKAAGSCLLQHEPIVCLVLELVGICAAYATVETEDGIVFVESWGRAGYVTSSYLGKMRNEM
jgi:hypothetical protein